MNKKGLAMLVGATFKQQKNNDLLFTSDLNDHFKNRYQSNICFTDEPSLLNTDTDPVSEPNSDPENSPTPEQSEDKSQKTGDDEPEEPEPNNKPEEENQEEKGKEEKDKGAEVPEKYELSLPDGVELDEEVLAAADPVFRELGLSNEQASKVAALHGELLPKAVEKALTEFKEQQSTAMQEQRETWRGDIKTQWGADYDKNLQLAIKPIVDFGDDEFKKFINDTGFGDNPVVINYFYNLGKAMQDDKLHVGGQGGDVVKSTAKALYNNSNMN